MLRAEYQRFLHTLNADYVPEGVRKIANLVSARIDTLIPLENIGTQHLHNYS